MIRLTLAFSLLLLSSCGNEENRPATTPESVPANDVVSGTYQAHWEPSFHDMNGNEEHGSMDVVITIVPSKDGYRITRNGKQSVKQHDGKLAEKDVLIADYIGKYNAETGEITAVRGRSIPLLKFDADHKTLRDVGDDNRPYNRK